MLFDLLYLAGTVSSNEKSYYSSAISVEYSDKTADDDYKMITLALRTV